MQVSPGNVEGDVEGAVVDDVTTPGYTPAEPADPVRANGGGGRINGVRPRFPGRRNGSVCSGARQQERGPPADRGVNRLVNEMIRESTLTCPACGHAKGETMPTDACQWFYECEQCHAVLKPRPGDCCVYCSYGTVPCPPIQERGSGDCCGD